MRTDSITTVVTRARCNEVSSWYPKLLGRVRRASWRRQQSLLQVVDRVPPDGLEAIPRFLLNGQNLGSVRAFTAGLRRSNDRLGWHLGLVFYSGLIQHPLSRSPRDFAHSLFFWL